MKIGWRAILGRFSGPELPAGFTGTLLAEERVLASAALPDGGHLIATSFGLWLPDGETNRRVGWHLISKATWRDGSLSVIEADEIDTVEDAVLLRDQRVRHFQLVQPRALPATVRQRVTGSILSSHRRDLAGGGAWFIQRKVPGRDGIVLQVRIDPDTDQAALRSVIARVISEIRRVRGD